MIPGKLASKLRHLLVTPELAQRAEAGDRLHPANTGRHAAFAEQLDQTDFPAGPGVRTATELG